MSKDYVQFLPRLRTRADFAPARLFNDAGIVGATLATVLPRAR
jgi:hypothetical protein